MGRVFRPEFGTGQNVTPTAVSARFDASTGDHYGSIMLTNTGANLCYVSFGDSSVIATAADFLLLPGASAVVGKRVNQSYIAYISAAGTTLNFIFGHGG